MIGTRRLMTCLLCFLLISLSAQAHAEEVSMGIVEHNGLEWYVGPNNIDWDEARSFCENLAEDGGGWRLPTLDELRGLYTGSENWESHHSLPPAFKGKELDCWWAWSSKTDDSSSAWFFAFDNGEEYYMYRDAVVPVGRVFAVRGKDEASGPVAEAAPGGGDEVGTFGCVAADNGVITCASTGLQWYVGSNNLDWNDSVSWAETLDVDGGGWRMPSLDELNGLNIGREYWDSHHSLPPAFKGRELGIYWAWSGDVRSSGSTWLYSFRDGEKDWYYNTSVVDKFWVFAVRSQR